MLKSNRLADGNHAGKLVVAIFVLFSVISSVTDKSPSSGLVTSPTNFSTPCKPDWPPEFLAILELQIVDPVVIGRVPGVVEMLREVDDLLMVENKTACSVGGSVWHDIKVSRKDEAKAVFLLKKSGIHFEQYEESLQRLCQLAKR